jgi:CcmD family protein
MADGMRSNGKIYVVVAVLVTVLAGLFLYLVRLEKRIKQIENSETIHMP